MIRLNDSKPVRRVVRIQTSNGAPKDFVMTIEPTGLIQFREKGRRRSVQLSVQQAFNRAQTFAAEAALLDDFRKGKRNSQVARGLLSMMRGRR